MGSSIKIYGKRGRIPIERIVQRSVRTADGCLLWLGAANTKGYGSIRDNGSNGASLSVHRVAYENAHGAIPSGMEIDHKCFRRNCVEPSHLEAVTHLENVRRGKHNQHHNKPVCKWGHKFTAETTLIDRRGYRACRPCSATRTSKWRAARRVAA